MRAKREITARLFMDPSSLFGNSVGVLAVPWLTARETAALIIVGISLVLFRVFRDRCLLAWGGGWLAYSVFLWASQGTDVQINPHATSKLFLALAPGGLRAGGRLVRDRGTYLSPVAASLTVIVALLWVVMVCAAMRPLLFSRI